MNRYILDTDHLTLLQNNHPEIDRRIVTIPPDRLFVTVITFEEQISGRLAGIARVSTQPDRWPIVYRNLRATLEFFDSDDVNLLSFDDRSLPIFQELKRQKIRIGTQDLKIASIALANTAIVVTRNQKDFGKIPNLILEDWTIAP